jgi:uncharacterized protein (TIGR02284 family)
MDLQNINTLNTLIATTIDSANGFEEAAKNARATSLAQQFAELARDRWAIVETLEDEVRRLGSEPKRSGTAKAAAHRRWLDLKNAVAGSDRAVVQEVENGETYLVTKYEAVLAQQDLSTMTRSAIENAYSEIRRGQSRIEGLALMVGSSDSAASNVNWGRIGLAVALGGAAFAATRYARSRRRTSTQRHGVTIAIDRTTTAEIESRNREGAGVTGLAANASELDNDIDTAPRSTKRAGTRRSSASGNGAASSMAAGGTMGGESAGFQASGGSSDLSSGTGSSGSFGATGGSDDFKS